MNEQSNNSPTSNANPQNSTAPQSPSAAKSGMEKWKDWLDIIVKIVGITIAIGGAFWAKDLKDKLSAASLLVQREQAETNLRANMFNNLMERIVSKEQKERPPPERMLLLAQLLALNFDEHFQFKPMLVDLQKRLKPKELNELESVARRIVDRQTDMLRAAVRTQGDEYQQDHGKIQDIFTSDLFFKKSNSIPISYECNYIDESSFGILDKSALGNLRMLFINQAWVNTQQQPALFANKGPSQCIVVVSPDAKISPDSGYLLEMAVLAYNSDLKEKTVTVSVNVTGNALRSMSTVYEFEVTPFDFPLTDNTAIDSDHRFAIVQKNVSEDEIWLRLIWFPKGYITERERPMNYSEMRDALGVQKEKKKWYEFYK